MWMEWRDEMSVSRMDIGIEICDWRYEWYHPV